MKSVQNVTPLFRFGFDPSEAVLQKKRLHFNSSTNIALPCKRSYKAGVEFIAQLQGILQSITKAIKTGTLPLKCFFDIFLIFQRVNVSFIFSYEKIKTFLKCESDARHERPVQRTGG